MSGIGLAWKVLLAGLVVAAVFCMLPAGAQPVEPAPPEQVQVAQEEPVTEDVPEIVRPNDIIWVTENPQLYSFTQMRESTPGGVAPQPITRLTSFVNDSVEGEDENVVEIGPIDDRVQLSTAEFDGVFGTYYAVDEEGNVENSFTVVNASAVNEVSGNYTVFIDSAGFMPENITVPVNARVTWVNLDGIPHTITNLDPQSEFDIDSGGIMSDETFTYIFDIPPGVYTYTSQTGNFDGVVRVAGVTPGNQT